MSNRVRQTYTLFNAVDLSVAVSNSTVLDLNFLSDYYIQAVWTGTSPVGVLKLQASGNGTNWDDITSATANVSGNAGSASFNMDGQHYPHMRMVYTKGSGTGTLTAVANLKNPLA